MEVIEWICATHYSGREIRSLWRDADKVISYGIRVCGQNADFFRVNNASGTYGAGERGI
jgi:hypothetical protein